jgi:hypothetical protein
MKLPICIALLFLAAYASLHFAPEPKLEQIEQIEFNPPPLELPPAFKLGPHFMKPEGPAECMSPQSQQRCTWKI